MGLDNSSSHLIPAGYIVVAVKINPGAMRIVERDVAINQDLRGLQLRDELDPYFLSYYFKTINLVGNGTIVKGITNTKLGQVRIPVPPLEVQHEIVRILDKFNILGVQLEAELEARQRQYEYYRRVLIGTGDDVRTVGLGEMVSQLSSGRCKSRQSEGQYPVFGSTGEIGRTDDAAHSGDALLVARVGANAGRVNHVSGSYDVSDNTLIIRPTDDWDVRFAFHQLSLMNLNQYAVGGGQPLVTGKLLKSLTVHLPPLEEQHRTAKILDMIHALVNDRAAGLPAELLARRKQYEHYRDKLLTFRELPA